MSDLFANALRRDGPILIDGGLATQCETQGCDLNNSLWSAALLRLQPEALVAAHRAYLEAGAECIATASYQASRRGFMSLGVGKNEADDLIVRSVDLARQAISEFRRNSGGEPEPWIAASIGPYGAALHDGSEYTGDYSVTSDELREFHEQRLGLLEMRKRAVDEQELDVLIRGFKPVERFFMASQRCQTLGAKETRIAALKETRITAAKVSIGSNSIKVGESRSMVTCCHCDPSFETHISMPALGPRM